MLLLFDIDGTLLEGTTQPVGEAMRAALKEVHGVDTSVIRTQIATAGRTDGEIARAILLDAGVSTERIDGLAASVRESCCRSCARLLPYDLSRAVLPGVRELLDWLAEQEDVKLGLLTGNYEPIARLKLTRAGIGGAFPLGQGAFGSDAEDRTALPAIARRRASTVQAPYPRQETIVIGDTPRDIACARADGLRCVAVVSGPFRSDALAHADAVARDAAELRLILPELGIAASGGPVGGVRAAEQAPIETTAHVTLTEVSAVGARPDPARGVFETLVVRDGRLQALDRHVERLAAAVGDLYGHRLPHDLQNHARGIARALMGEHRLRVRAHPTPDGLIVRIETKPFSAPEPQPQPTIMLSPVLVPGGLGRYKWCDRRLLDNLSSRQSAPLIVDVEGDVLEASWANVWIVEGGRIVTPAADGRLLPGVTRSLLLECGPALGLTASTEPISVGRAREADAIFLTSSLRYAVTAALDGGPSPHRHSPVVKVLRTALSGAGWDP